MVRRRIKDLEGAKLKLETVTSDIRVLEYAGKVTDNTSVFYNTINSKTFTTSLNGLVKRIKKGDDLSKIGLGKGSSKLQHKKQPRNLEEDLVEWLANNVPHVKLIHFAGSFNKDCKFRRIDTETLHTLSPNRLKDKFRRGLQIFPTTSEITQARRETRQAKGIDYCFSGKGIPELSKELGVGYSTFQSTVKYRGIEEALKLSPGKSFLETKVASFLEKESINYINNKKIDSKLSYRPDFYLPNYNIIIECDGLYWHSDAILDDKYYHFNKRKDYIERGYMPLFFRSDEIKHKFPIIKSMILHRCGMVPGRIYARNTVIREIKESRFFEENHLMGRGAGIIFALIDKDDRVVCGLQVKKLPNIQGYEISRFCSKIDVLVVGGFTRLLKYAKNKLRTTRFDTFVDLRYGSGKYLESLHFKPMNNPTPSFCWTNGKDVVHRMRYKGNSGYRFGLYKIWDCGQLKLSI